MRLVLPTILPVLPASHRLIKECPCVDLYVPQFAFPERETFQVLNAAVAVRTVVWSDALRRGSEGTRIDGVEAEASRWSPCVFEHSGRKACAELGKLSCRRISDDCSAREVQ